MRPFEATGLWWTPKQPAAKQAGTLSFSEQSGLELDLVGTLGDWKLAQETHPLIFGSAYGLLDHKSGAAVTLTDCKKRRTRASSHGFPRETYHARRAFVGDHLEEFRFLGATVKLCGLEDWAQGLTGMEAVLARDPDGHPHSELKSLGAAIPGGKLTLYAAPEVTHSVRTYTVSESVAFCIECEQPMSEDAFNGHYIYPLQNFLTFALGRPSAVRDFNVHGGVAVRDVEVVGSRIYSEAQYNADNMSANPLFLLPHVQGRFSDVINRWLRISSEFRDTCNLFFGIQYQEKSYLDTRFLTVVQSLELYHSQGVGNEAREREAKRYERILGGLERDDKEWLQRRLGRQPHISFSETIEALLREHGAVVDPLVKGDRAGFVASAVAAYEYILHRRLVSERAPQSDNELYWLMERLRILMMDCLMSELGFSIEERLGIFSGNPFYSYLRRIDWPMR